MEGLVYESFRYSEFPMTDIPDPDANLRGLDKHLFYNQPLPHLSTLMGDNIIAIPNHREHSEDCDP
jgi:hypothetical protein